MGRLTFSTLLSSGYDRARTSGKQLGHVELKSGDDILQIKQTFALILDLSSRSIRANGSCYGVDNKHDKHAGVKPRVNLALNRPCTVARRDHFSH